MGASSGSAQFSYRRIPVVGWFRLIRFTSVALVGFAFYIGPHMLSKHRPTRFAVAYLRLLARASGLEITVAGATLEPRSLIVANHISWTDILALGGLAPVRFVTKSDVAHWPILGVLASLSGALFVDRTRRQDVHNQVQKMQSALESDSLVLFPEGTTGDGIDMLPFRAALFASATGRTIQPVTLRYNSRTATPDWTVDTRLSFAWDRDKPFIRHAVAIIAGGGARCAVHVHEAVAVSDDRKALASACHAVIKQTFTAAAR